MGARAKTESARRGDARGEREVLSAEELSFPGDRRHSNIGNDAALCGRCPEHRRYKGVDVGINGELEGEKLLAFKTGFSMSQQPGFSRKT